MQTLAYNVYIYSCKQLCDYSIEKEKRPRETNEDGVIRKDRPQAKGQDTGVMKENIKLLFCGAFGLFWFQLHQFLAFEF